jgi:hypothetical protein
MIRIPIRVAGDQWCNRSEVVELLQTVDKHSYITLDAGAEGASLHRLGIVKTVLDSGVDSARVTVANWPNAVEVIPFCREVHHITSHFFWHHSLHCIDGKFANQTPNLFGLFVGRRTVSRCKILYDVFKQYKEVSCLSLMNDRNPVPWEVNRFVDVEQLSDWVDHSSMPEFIAWWSAPPIGSIDGHSINDQYRAGNNTNQDLLTQYNKFDLEIVCETYCYGDAFFPTEKTVRPIAARKPFVTFGPVHFLKRLRDMGFRTFGDFWDESYDESEGVDRWQKIQQVLQHFVREKQQNTTLIKELNTVTKHNRTHLNEIVTRFRPR